MRAVRFHETGGPEVLQIDEVETPTPDKGEILETVEAAAVNPSETSVQSTWDEYPQIRSSSPVAGEVPWCLEAPFPISNCSQ
jgi:NADPH:quinone reductase-like Zn-dependent oxidoreductase